MFGLCSSPPEVKKNLKAPVLEKSQNYPVFLQYKQQHKVKQLKKKKMKTYYLMDSTIFSKTEDVVAALKSGKIVKNDDKRVDFMIKKHYGKDTLYVRDAFFGPDKWATVARIASDSDIVNAMDNVVDSMVSVPVRK